MASKKQPYVLPGNTLEQDPNFGPYRDMVPEGYLRQHGIEFRVDSVLDLELVKPRQDQDEGKTTAQIRVIDAVIPEVVDRYVLDLAQGANFPGICVNHSAARGVFEVIWGNNRRASHVQAGRTTIPAYIVHVSQDVAQKIAEWEQTSQAQPLSDKDIEALILSHLRDGMTHTEIADRLHLKSPSAVSGVAARNRAALRLESVGHDVTLEPYKKIVKSAGKSLALDAIHDDDVYAKAASIAAETAMTVPEIRNMGKELGEIRNAAQELTHLDLVKVERQAKVDRQRLKISPPPAVQIRKWVSSILNFTAEQLVASLDDLERQHLVEDMTALYDLSSDVLHRLGLLNGNGGNGAPHAPARKRATAKAPS